jgi:hypothetical protein
VPPMGAPSIGGFGALASHDATRPPPFTCQGHASPAGVSHPAGSAFGSGLIVRHHRSNIDDAAPVGKPDEAYPRPNPEPVSLSALDDLPDMIRVVDPRDVLVDGLGHRWNRIQLPLSDDTLVTQKQRETGQRRDRRDSRTHQGRTNSRIWRHESTLGHAESACSYRPPRSPMTSYDPRMSFGSRGSRVRISPSR